MADFSLSQIGEVAPGGPSPQRGVQQPSAIEAGAGLISDLFKAHSAGAPGRADEAKAEKEAAEQAVLGRFTRQQLSIAEAVDTGELSSQEARMRLRANLSAALGDNPALTESLSNTHKQILGTAGMGKVAAEGTEEEQAFFAVQDQAMKDGWLTQGMNPDEMRESTFAYMQFKREQQRIEAEKNELSLVQAKVNLESSRVGLETSRLNLQQKRAQVASQTAAGTMADAGLTRIRNKAEVLKRQVDSGQMPPEEAVEILDGEWLTISSVVQAQGTQAGGEYISNLLAPSQNVYQTYRGYISGETPAATLESISNNAVAQQSAMLTGDPEIARWAATSQIFGQSASLVLDAPAVRQAVEILGNNSEEGGRAADLTNPATQQSTRDYLRLLEDGVSRVNSGNMLTDPEATQSEVQVNINNVLKGVGDYGRLVDNPRELNDVTSFLSSDSFGRYVEQHGTGIRQDRLGEAGNVFDAQFDEVVRPLIAEEWRNATLTTSVLPQSPVLGTEGQTEAAATLIKPFFSNGGIRFVIANDADSTTRLEAKIRNLNNRVAPVINRFVKLGAHLEGHRDYQRIYESNYAQLFGDAGTGAEADE